MVDDVAMPSDPLIAPVEKEELEEAPFDANVFQRSHKEESSKKMVHTRVDRSAWDHRLSLNPHALAIYLEFVLACGTTPKRFEEC
jgi:hypothetical protein